MIGQRASLDNKNKKSGRKLIGLTSKVNPINFFYAWRNQMALISEYELLQLMSPYEHIEPTSLLA